MKILLVGDYSGVHTAIKEELKKRGHKVAVVDGKDGFKNYPSDIDLGKNAITPLGKQIENIRLRHQLKKMKDYDIVQFINPYPIYEYLTSEQIMELMDSAKLSVVLLCGCDGAFYRNYSKIDANLCRKCEEIEKAGKCCYRKINQQYLKYEEEFYKKVDVMIPLDWCYQDMHNTDSEKIKMVELLPMPITINSEPVITVGDKLKVLHPLNRKGVKGTPVIREAFIQLERKYKNRAEFIIDGRMPYKQYEELMKSVDIVLDQTYSASAGMTALLAMEQGKIVMGGNLDNAILEEQVRRHQELPMLSLGDNVTSIIENVSNLLDMSNEQLLQKKKDSRIYIKKYHDVSIVVDALLEDYKKSGKFN